MSIEINNISKNFGRMPVLKDISIKVEDGELLALLGPSGSGKTTLLRVISGIEAADTGSIYFHGHDATNHSVKERKVGFVFQHYALFRHMNVFENIAFGLRVIPRRSRPARKEINERVGDLLRLVQLEKFSDRYPSQLSGGQRQRIALARALAVEPEILLLDEPFGALDAMVRRELRKWLRRLHDELKITSVFVTHDQEEAFEVADRVVIMNDGKVEQIGSPEDVYKNPKTPFVYNFIGQVNKIEGEIRDGNFIANRMKIPLKEMHKHINWQLRLEFLSNVGKIPLKERSLEDINGLPASVFIRPHEVLVGRTRTDKSEVEAKITDRRSIGYFIQLELLVAGSKNYMEAMLPMSKDAEYFKKGEKVFISFANAGIFLEK